MKKYFEKKKLVKYMDRLLNPKVPWPNGYIEYHKTEINSLEWLIEYYEGGTASTPVEYLEALLNKHENYGDYAFEMLNHGIAPMSEVERLKMKLRDVSFLYNWVHHKRITGF